MQATQIFTPPHTLKMQKGNLYYANIAYETWGKLNEDSSNVILIFTGLSPSAHAASSQKDPSTGWWEDMIGSQKPVDTDKYFVICMNSLGSCFGSTGPASINPETKQPYRLSFPKLTLEDIAYAGKLLLEHLNIETLHTLIGGSMGGMVALAFHMMYPSAAMQTINISSADRSTTFAIALRSLQREIIQADPLWRKGNYDLETPPFKSMLLARKLGMISYRSPQEFSERFGRNRITEECGKSNPFCMEFEIESYLDHTARKFTRNFDPNAYLYLSKAMDMFDLANHTTKAQKLSDTLKKALVIGVSTDILFPTHQQESINTFLNKQGVQSSLTIINSKQGHDAFLVDMDRFRPVIANFLET